ncbi:hypothetical protein PAHAL_3G220800 [Panicum hallii]|uniref:Uncharacterized protein n=1 Tax=Panicum hallii TaxID=206008 RepID=A0A2S3HAN8_9POAL|nr:uncharacterized protein LOC112885794 [Panicum hallii]PAN18751.2 hypothetical protein PAHAL_3G220800 [Panicum hallii]
MADANKRINLAAPLISVRRHGGDGNGPTATGLPAYRADATSGPLGHTGAGAVPFGWEHRPGHPKSVRTRRALPSTIADAPSRVARKPAAVTAASERAREEERFSDALSRDDVSCVTVNCSATGLSDAASVGAGARAAPGARGSVMMDRFLPAAHAVAAGSPQSTFRKAGSARNPTGSPAVPSSARTGGGGGGGRSAAQMRLPFQHIAACRLPPLPPEGKNEDGDDDDAGSDAHSTAGFAPRRCGLLPGRCLESSRLLSRGARRGAGRPFLSSGGGSRKAADPLLRRSRNGQQQPQHTGDDPGMQSWEEVYIKSLLRSGGGGGGLMGPAAAVVSELDRTVRELYRHRGGQAVKPKASHLGLLLVLDRSNEDCGRGYHGSSTRKLSRAGDAALLLPATTRSSPNAGNKLGRGVAGDDAGKYGFPLLLEDAAAVAGREMALSPQPLLSLPLPKSPSESWLSLALPSVSTRPPPAASFLGLHVQSKKHAPLPWCSIDSGKGIDHDGQRQRRVHDLQK